MATIDNIVADLRKAIESAKSGKTQAYDTVATVKRVVGNTAWVQIPGGTSETPVQLTIACQPGDTVQVRVGGGRAWLTGNQSAPPTDDTTARSAQVKAGEASAEAGLAQETADEAGKAANEAKQIAGNTNQYFWHTETGSDTGAHITEKTQEEFLADPQNGGGNTIMRSNGMAVRDGLTELATFGADEARIGQSSASHSVIDSNGHRFYASDGTTQLANIGYGAGSSAAGVVTNAPYYTFGTRKSPTNDYSASSTYNIGDMCWYTTNGVRRPYICETPITTPEAWTREHWLLAIGNESFAEGRRVVAAHLATHAEGVDTIAIGRYSHAEGVNSRAYGYASHAEGEHCIASGSYSHAQNRGTIASKTAQTVIGKYNLEDTSDTDDGEYAFIIGNGTATATYYRSNAFTVDWNGNVEAAGHITSAITACDNNSTDLSLTTSEQRIPMTTYRHVVGEQLSVDSNGVLCGKDGFVEVSANIYFVSGFNTNDLVHLIIKNGSTNIINASHKLAGAYDCYSVAPIVYEVSAGDIFYLYSYNQTAARGKVSRSTLSWLTVKYL